MSSGLHSGSRHRRLAAALAAPLAWLLLAGPAHAADGTWERAWGKDVDTAVGTGFEICAVAANCQTGATGGLGGELSFPGEGVATDAAGNVYVADQVNHRIQKFDSAGNWQRAWGKDVVAGGGTGFEICVVAANCQAGTQGGLGGELDSPRFIATDAAGNVYVADRGNQRIQKFDPVGNWERAWGKDVIQSGMPGDLGAVFEVCTVAANCKTGVSGGLGGELSFPTGVATDTAGAVYVADTANHRIQKFNSAGNWERAWGKDVDTAAGTGFEICTVAANCKAGDPIGGGAGGELNEPIAVATDAGAVYVVDRLNQRIQKFDSAGNWQRAWGKDVDIALGTGFEICTVAVNCKTGATGGLGGELNNPIGIATDGGGSVYLADRFNQRIQKFDSAGNWQRAWGKDVIDPAAPENTGTGFEICTVAANCKAGTTGGLGGELNTPIGVATDVAGAAYVADQDNHRIQKFAAPSPPPPPPPPDGGDGQGTPAKAARTLTLDANKPKVKKGKAVTLSGQLEATGNDPACEQNQSVEILRTGLEGGTPTQVATAQTDAQGSFATKVKVKKSSLYTARVQETPACEPETSDTEKVRVKKPKAAKEA
ncbi:MAG TPA: hypothetical protein VEK39_14555 [Solirubrobacterales bacterium]|nr:hypothetical protein [Solirubrobacterales bacterium]